jgi:hypothetical protein
MVEENFRQVVLGQQSWGDITSRVKPRRSDVMIQLSKGILSASIRTVLKIKVRVDVFQGSLGRG